MRSKLSFANVCSFLALLIAVGTGGAYAADTIGSADVIDNSLLSADLKNNQAVKSADVVNENLTGTDIANASVGFSDLAYDSVTSSEVVDESIRSADIQDGTLNDEDIAQGAYVNFTGNIGNVPAQSCVDKTVSGIDARLDHVVLSPDWNTTRDNLSYTAFTSSQSGVGEGFMKIRACNPTTAAINAGVGGFNLLVIDAQ